MNITFINGIDSTIMRNTKHAILEIFCCLIEIPCSANPTSKLCSVRRYMFINVLIVTSRYPSIKNLKNPFQKKKSFIFLLIF